MTVLSRRGLVQTGAVAALVGPALATTDGVAVAASSSPARYARSRFRPLVGRTFQLEGGGRRWTLRLHSVTDLPLAPRGAEGCFSLTFRCAAAGPPQGTYTLRRSGFAPTTLFVVAVDARSRTYEAVVNNG